MIRVIDCIDYERSIPTYFKSSGRLSGFKKIAFVPEKIKDIPIFKVPEHTVTRIYVSDAFRNAVLDSKLKGLDFNEVWDSEITEDMARQKEQKYADMLANIEKNKGEEFDWNTAAKLMESGKAVASGKWKLQADVNGNMLIGQLAMDGSYSWVEPFYIPPVLLELNWHEIEKTML
ncbi:imm11 family protein [Paenibacillus sp. OV219]|uniref:imm11 family protein n=1 Tax=Paenibacillus sp. OV219 TaxID=1884377 RepID=UPI0008CC6D9D|nr:DUF1629 domain-containing protein [Paenibacillus sp. OV219]SEN79693.1 hypothetical protein SAMN05518847_104164 [Paenibacillus sp. OV219]